MPKRTPGLEAAQEKRELEKTAQEVERRNELKALKDILADRKVRDFLYRVMANTGMFKDHFSPNAAVMGHNCGYALAGNMIYNEIVEAWPEAWIQMQFDALEAQRLREAIEHNEKEQDATEDD
jgi:hypothetical protein